MAGFYLAVGEEFFDNLRRSGCYYVDKTEMIYEIAGAGGARVTLFTRPRRFGKTLAMSMLQSFFDITKDSRDVFEGLAVTKHADFCRQWMNRYPVLFLSLKDVCGLDFENAYAMLKARIADLCKKHFYLADSQKVNVLDQQVFLKLCAEDAGISQVKDALLLLTRMLHAHYDRPAVLLLDEYDVPLAKAYDAQKASPEYARRMLDLMRALMSSALKTNEYLKFAVITGCLRVAKESIFTGVNNFKTYSILDRRYCSSFGFTKDEVKALLNEAGYADQMDRIQSWYDGYVFGDREIFCPWDVVNFVWDLLENPNKEPDNYWKYTSGNDILRFFAHNLSFQVSEKFETLMNGGTIVQTISDELTYHNLSEKEDNLWSVLFMTGYLTKAEKLEYGRTVHLRIPNTEVAEIFQETVVACFRDSMDGNVQMELMETLWNGKEQEASRIISDLLWDTISYNNYHENYYHAFLTGLFAGQPYVVKSDQENGLGRTDLVVNDPKNRRAILIEAKKADTEDAMEKECVRAKRQIIDKQYARGLSGYTSIVCYGIAFYQKTALVRRLEE